MFKEYKKNELIYMGWYYEFDRKKWSLKYGPVKYISLEVHLNFLNGEIKKHIKKTFNIENTIPQKIMYHIGDILIVPQSLKGQEVINPFI